MLPRRLPLPPSSLPRPSSSLRPSPHSRTLDVPSPIRTLIAPPRPNSGPLMTRRSDRALPPLHTSRRWLLSIPLFLSILTVSTLSIFNYQKSSSPIVASAMYALRTNARAREYLGDEVTFKDRVPWIWGEMNQLHGRIDVQWGVKGGREKGWVRFKSERRGRMGKFTTQEWSLETSDGRIIDLLEENGGVDPFQQPATTPVEATHEGGRTVL